MTRLSLILFCVLMLSGLSVVNSHHQARKLYIELEQLAENAELYTQEYGQLQLEQSTWAMHSRVELIAAQAMQMQVPDQKRLHVVALTKAPLNVIELAKPGPTNPGLVTPAQEPN